MKWAVIALSVITALFVVLGFVASAKVRHAEDNWNVVGCMIGAMLFGVADFVLIIIWLAIS